MSLTERYIVVRAGSEVVGEEALPLARLPSGAIGAIYRGQVFPLFPDGSVDIAGQFYVPGACSLLDPAHPPRPPIAWWVLPQEPPVLLIRGDEDARDRLLDTVVKQGGEITASGPYLAGGDVDVLADWFALPRGMTADEVRAALGRAAEEEQGVSLAPATPSVTAAEREAFLRDALALLRSEVQDAVRRVGEMAAQLKEAETAWIAESEARAVAESLAAAEKRAADAEQVRPPPRPASAKRAAEEIGEAISALLPNLALLKDTKAAIALGFSDRGPCLRALRALHDHSGETLRAWKGVRGAAGWRERHVSTGQDDSGRIYARVRKDGIVEILLSFKGSQDRDVEWLSRQ